MIELTVKDDAVKGSALCSKYRNTTLFIESKGSLLTLEMVIFCAI